MEGICQNLYELPEIDSSVCNVVEYGLSAVTLVFHIANLHLQSEILCNLPGTYHRIVFPRFGLFVLLQIYFTCFSVYPLYLDIGFEPGLFHLQ